MTRSVDVCPDCGEEIIEDLCASRCSRMREAEVEFADDVLASIAEHVRRYDEARADVRAASHERTLRALDVAARDLAEAVWKRASVTRTTRKVEESDVAAE